MRRVVFAALAFALPVLACGKKGLPPECDKYLVKYDCYMTKVGMSSADKQKTLDGMRTTWVTSSNTPAGRTAVLGACQKMDAEMTSKFAEKSCN